MATQDYVLNGTTTFTFPFAVRSASALTLELVPGGVVSTGDYTVTGAGPTSTGVTVTYPNAPTSATTVLRITRYVQPDRATTLNGPSDVTVANLNAEFDNAYDAIADFQVAGVNIAQAVLDTQAAQAAAEDAQAAAEAAAAGVDLPSITSADVGKMLIATSTPSWSLVRATNTADTATIARRDSGGRLLVGTPTVEGHAVTKAYADALGASTATANTVARRDANGRLQVATPSAAADAATKDYVDGRYPGGVIHPNVAGNVVTRSGTYTTVQPGTGGSNYYVVATMASGAPIRPGCVYYMTFTESTGATLTDGWTTVTTTVFPPSTPVTVLVVSGTTALNAPASGTLTIHEWDMTATGARMSDAVESVSCNTDGSEFAVIGSAGAFEFVSGSAKTGSALLGIQPGSVARALGGSADSRIHQFVNASGTATAPTIASLTVVPD